MNNPTKKKQITNPSICIIAHKAYGNISGGNTGHIGGVEWQTSLTARWFAAKGYRVTFLTWDEGGPAEEIVDSIKIIKLCRKNAGLPGLRFISPKWTRLCSAMERAGADIYYQNGAECVTGQAAFWCRTHNKKFIFVAAIDSDCEQNLPELSSFKDRWLYKYGLKHADKIIVQTNTQARLMDKNFKRTPIVIPMPCKGLSEDEFLGRHNKHSKRILWIGRVCSQKRPDWLLDLAEQCPDFEFDVVGPLYGDVYTQKVVERGKSIQNVVFHGPISRDRIWEFYKSCSLLCCTSDVEGFPNTFLEAWSCGVPIVTTFDPDNIIARKQIGIVCKTIKELRDGIVNLTKNPDRYLTAAKNARTYYQENHALEKAMPKFEEVFLSLI